MIEKMNGKQDIRRVVALLKEEGFRKNSAFYLKETEDGALFYGVGLSVRPTSRPEIMHVNVYSAVLWDELEHKTFWGLGLEYRRGISSTWSRLVSSRRSFLVGGVGSHERQKNTQNLKNCIFQKALPMAQANCSLDKLETYVMSRVLHEGMDLEKSVVLADIRYGKSEATARLKAMLNSDISEFEKSTLERFGQVYFAQNAH